jgi:hypothetical protein
MHGSLWEFIFLDSCWSLPLWIPASAGMTKGAGITFPNALTDVQQPNMYDSFEMTMI